MADPKGTLIKELERQLESKTAEIDSKQKDVEMCIRQRDAAEKLRDDWKDKCIVLQNQYDECEAHRKALIEENNLLICEKTKLMDKLDSAEEELEKANHRLELEINEKARVDRLYDEIKIKNANICSTIADMVRKIMQE